MAQDEAAATSPPQMAEEHDSTTVQPPTEEEDHESPIRPESGEQTAARPDSGEDVTATVQATEEEQQSAVEEDDAAMTRPGSGEETSVGSEPEEANTAAIEIASDEEHAATLQPREKDAKPDPIEQIRLELPTGRVKKIMKLDTDINKINSEALHLVSCSAQLFLQFLTESSGQAAVEKKRKIVKLEHVRTAAKRHRATRDFLVDELPAPAQPSDQMSADRSRTRPVAEKPAPAGTRWIDDFFSKPSAKSNSKSPIEVEEKQSTHHQKRSLRILVDTDLKF